MMGRREEKREKRKEKRKKRMEERKEMGEDGAQLDDVQDIFFSEEGIA